MGLMLSHTWSIKGGRGLYKGFKWSTQPPSHLLRRDFEPQLHFCSSVLLHLHPWFLVTFHAALQAAPADRSPRLSPAMGQVISSDCNNPNMTVFSSQAVAPRGI